MQPCSQFFDYYPSAFACYLSGSMQADISLSNLKNSPRVKETESSCLLSTVHAKNLFQKQTLFLRNERNDA